MKKKLLFLFLMFCGSQLFAQVLPVVNDTIRTLIISEARMDNPGSAYLEITNVGTDTIDLKTIKFGNISTWDGPYFPLPNKYVMLPDKKLLPGKSFVIASMYDFEPEMFSSDPLTHRERVNKQEFWSLADFQVHWREVNSIPGKDSITPGDRYLTFDANGAGSATTYFLEQKLANGDSIVIDQVGGVFDSEWGKNKQMAYDVAGITAATATTTLIRKFNVKKGNLDFANARGIDLTDSEWIPVKHLYGSVEPWRALFWTAGNHGDYNIDATTLSSSVVTVDWANGKLTVPWGIRNNDGLMKQFVKKPGIAWHYDLSPVSDDSLLSRVCTGDKLTLYAVGNDMDTKVLDIVVTPPTAGTNIVVPRFRLKTADNNSGNNEVYRVSENASGMDTISRVHFATRVDSLLNFLEKAPEATWKIEWVDKQERADLKNGDILKVTAKNGAVKQYFIKVVPFIQNNVPLLSAITWPDIPESFKPLAQLLGWKGDTIPGFNGSIHDYKVVVPQEVNNIPALMPTMEDKNATLSVKRAANLTGTLEQRTTVFTVSSEDQSVVKVYKIVFEKEKNPEDIQPYAAEPFISEVVFQEQYRNAFLEIYNPGNVPLDLSKYFILYANQPPATVIANTGNTFTSRYEKYVPGYKWVSAEVWNVKPSTLEKDLAINPIVAPGDVFVLGHTGNTPSSKYPWFASQNTDVDFFRSPWPDLVMPHNGFNAVRAGATNRTYYLFKIINDSITAGLKAASDLKDFQLIDVFGMGGGGVKWTMAGIPAGKLNPSRTQNDDQCMNFIREPQYYKGTPIPGIAGSFGTNEDDCQWRRTYRIYWEQLGYGMPAAELNVAIDIGYHTFNELTFFKSTVSSYIYKVSPGYSTSETIRGLKTGTTVNAFLTNIIKADTGQVLTLKSILAGAVLTGNQLLSNNDTLVVLSADSVNTSKYILEVTQQGLSSNALLASNRYQIVVNGGSNESTRYGTITGFDYGTTLTTVLNSITLPGGASMSIIDAAGTYVPLKILNYDTIYVKTTVNSEIYFEVIAEDGITKVVYQLVPNTSQNDAFLLSDFYEVIQRENLVKFVPRGTSVQTFLSSVMVSAGATAKLVDKLGAERTQGRVWDDDKVVVTSPNKLVTRAYHITFLATESLAPNNLAYILSNIYQVDQIVYKVDGVSGIESVSSFLSKVTPATGASAAVVDKNGAAKTTGDINGGDKVKVTSQDGKLIVYYTFGSLTSANVIGNDGLSIYPNPTEGIINISGIEKGCQITIFNSLGVIVSQKVADKNLEVISLNNQPTGLYLIQISKQGSKPELFKIIKSSN
jgi:hypothetical protein